MKTRVLGVLLLSVVAITVLLGPTGSAQVAPGSSGAEPDGTEGFGVAVGSAPASPEGQDPLTPKLEGVVEVDTYLNIRTGPWGKIIGGLNNGAKVKIISKEGDWFKILNGTEISYIHSYYVSAPGYPSHQGVEPPILGSDESPAPVTGDPGSSPTVDNGTFGAEPCSPMPDSVSSDFGPRDIDYGSRYHEGIDLPISNGTRVNALGNGVVTDAGYSEGGGNYVYIRYDNGYTSFYCHLESVSVSNGQRVAIGQDVALSDNTGTQTSGAHLHMGIMDSSGEYVNPRDVPGLEFPPLVE